MSNVTLGTATSVSATPVSSEVGPPPPNTNPPSKRRRRTKAEMAAHQAELEVARLRKQQERDLAKLKKQKASSQLSQGISLRGRHTSQSTRSSKSAKPDEVEDRGKPFTQTDYENVMSYMEDSKNYTALYGDGSKTSIGSKPLTKGQAFEVFATWLNQLNPELRLNGRRLIQRIDRWKKKIIEVKHFEENTGAGIEDQSGEQCLYDMLEQKCPCYHRLDALL